MAIVRVQESHEFKRLKSGVACYKIKSLLLLLLSPPSNRTDPIVHSEGNVYCREIYTFDLI